ncbi:hypothetical protein ACFLU5_04890 [Bacteroidota bacterium]
MKTLIPAILLITFSINGFTQTSSDLNSQLLSELEAFRVEYSKCMYGNNDACDAAMESLENIRFISQRLIISIKHDVHGGPSSKIPILGDYYDQLLNEIEAYKVEFEKYIRGNKSAGVRAIGYLSAVRSIAQKLRNEIRKDSDEIIICPTCGAENSVLSNTCTSCGCEL